MPSGATGGVRALPLDVSQTRAELSDSASSHRAFGAKSRFRTGRSSVHGPRSALPLKASCTQTAPLSSTLAVSAPSGLIVMWLLPSRVITGKASSRGASSQTRTVPSAVVVMSRLPVPLNQAPATGCPCRSGGVMALPEAQSQTRAAQSRPAVTARRPSGLIAAKCTSPP